MSYGDDDNYMTWSNNSPSSGIYDMYSSFLTYFERLNQLYRDYALNIQRINDSYKESIRIIETINDANKEYIENYSKMNQLYKQHFEDMQRMNQQWLIFCGIHLWERKSRSIKSIEYHKALGRYAIGNKRCH
jgi:hypothetical protein